MKTRGKDDQEKRLQRNANDRKRYAELPRENKDAILHQRRQRYAERKSIAQSAKANNSGVRSHYVPHLIQRNDVTDVVINHSAELLQSKDGNSMECSLDKNNHVLTSHRIPCTDERLDMNNIVINLPTAKKMEPSEAVKPHHMLDEAECTNKGNIMIDTVKRLRRNANDRRRYMGLQQEKKDAMVHQKRQRYAKRKHIAQSAEANNLGDGSHVVLPMTQPNNLADIVINHSTELQQSKDLKIKRGSKRKILSSDKNNEALTSHQIPFTDENIYMNNNHPAGEFIKHVLSFQVPCLNDGNNSCSNDITVPIDDSATKSYSHRIVHVFEQRPQTGYANKGIVIKDVDKQDLTGHQNRGPLQNIAPAKAKLKQVSIALLN